MGKVFGRKVGDDGGDMQRIQGKDMKNHKEGEWGHLQERYFGKDKGR